MKKLTYVTEKHDEFIFVKKKLEENNIPIDYFGCEMNGFIINDLSSISKGKAEIAHILLEGPVLVSELGFYIEEYPKNRDYPGAFLKESKIESNIDELLETMKHINKRNCSFIECLTYFDGEELKQFYGTTFGELSEEIKGDTTNPNLFNVFIPSGSDKTISEMTDEEKEKYVWYNKRPIKDFAAWYKKQYKEENKEYVKSRNN